MRPSCHFRLTLLLASLAPAVALAASKLPEGPEVLVVADLYDQKSGLTRPTKQRPVHFFVFGGTELSLGDAIAGEPMPRKETVAAAIAAALVSQGFTATQVGGPVPDIAIVFSYGTANLATAEINDTDPSTGETTTSIIGFNSREIAQLVGADRASRRMLMSSEADRINEAARDNRVYIFVAALDVEALRKKQRKLIWRTRMSIDARRRTLPETMKVMLASAAPYFGTNTDLPQFIEDADRRKAEVIIGTPKVVEDEVAKPPPKK
ncbi:MAG: hypothetical protein HZA93_10795 [Verrucomicrobia bacterium]|nr:hypothetical protein [Verrucomicrobiota bacterium]